MANYKIAVYAIAKNEILHCERWANATQGADYRIVVDTGSTDGTQDKLKELGVSVYQSRIQPFRFDVARNTALALVPDDADVCLILDMDEVPEPKFFDKVRKGWKPGANLGWISMDTGQKWERDRLHSRDGFVWKYPCHEVQLWYGEGEAVGVNIKNAVIKHEPDQDKSRGQYLGLLELAVKENPLDARMWTYMCREYYFHSKWEDVIKAAEKQLECTGWDVEQAAVCRWAGESEWNIGNKEKATAWFDKGVQYLPREGEPWYGVAIDAYRNNKWSKCLEACVNIFERPRSVHYCYESAVWDWKAADLASISAYNLRHINEAIAFAKEAIKGNGPETDRIQRNLDFYEKVRDEIRAQPHKQNSRVGL
jgi:glycosyltransferase involved in cell wall biosynthesis